MGMWQGIILQLLLLSILSEVSCKGMKMDIVKLLQERIKTHNTTTINNTCQCTCGKHPTQNVSTTPNPNGGVTLPGSCGGCGCACCVTCSQFRENVKFVQRRPKHSKRLDELPPMVFEICLILYKLYDYHVTVMERDEEMKDLIGNGFLTSSSEYINTTQLYLTVFAAYKLTYDEVQMVRELSGNFNDTNCNADGTCSNITWTRGCTNCMPDINLTPTCVPPTTTEPSTLEPQTPAPLNLSLCICARILILPLEALQKYLDEVNIKIQNTMVELWECRYQEDALERARDLAVTLLELIVEMSSIVDQINSYTEQRAGRFITKKLSTLQSDVTSMKSSLIRNSLGVNCDDRGQTVVQHVMALEWSIKLFVLSPTNNDVQHNLHCRTYLTTTLIFKLVIGKITLNDDDISTLKDIFSELISDDLVSVYDNIEDMLEWNNARAETLEQLLEKLHEEKQDIEDRMS